MFIWSDTKPNRLRTNENFRSLYSIHPVGLQLLPALFTTWHRSQKRIFLCRSVYLPQDLMVVFFPYCYCRCLSQFHKIRRGNFPSELQLCRTANSQVATHRALSHLMTKRQDSSLLSSQTNSVWSEILIHAVSSVGASSNISLFTFIWNNRWSECTSLNGQIDFCALLEK